MLQSRALVLFQIGLDLRFSSKFISGVKRELKIVFELRFWRNTQDTLGVHIIDPMEYL